MQVDLSHIWAKSENADKEYDDRSGRRLSKYTRKNDASQKNQAYRILRGKYF
jgi:hypothetical protein